MAECNNCLHKKVCKYAEQNVSVGLMVKDTVHECVDCMPAAKWIDVNERLPETSETVLCYVKSTTISGAECFTVGNCYHQKAWYLQNSVGTTAYPMHFWEVTHWMPLPEPLQKEG